MCVCAVYLYTSLTLMCCRFDQCVEYYKTFGIDQVKERIIKVLQELEAASTAVATAVAVPANENQVSGVYIAVYVAYLTCACARQDEKDGGKSSAESAPPEGPGGGGGQGASSSAGGAELVRSGSVYASVYACVCDVCLCVQAEVEGDAKNAEKVSGRIVCVCVCVLCHSVSVCVCLC